MKEDLCERFVLNIREIQEPSAFEVEMAIGKMNRHKLSGIDQIQAQLIIAGCRTIFSETTQLLNSVWNKEDMPEDWKQSIIVPNSKKGNKTDCNNYRGISQFVDNVQTFFQHPAVKINSL